MLHLGSHKQVFADDLLIAERVGTERRVNRPVRHPANPIMRPQGLWEFGYISLYHGAVHRTPEGGFRMWYRSYDFEDRERHYSLLATSSDGLNWERPNLGLIEFRGSRDNSLLCDWNEDAALAAGFPRGLGNVIEDPCDPDPNRRFKTVYCWKGPDVAVAFSPDGLYWSGTPENPVVTDTSDTHTLLGWDEACGKYVGYFRPRCSGHAHAARVIGRSISDDFLHWTYPEVVLEPDAHDPVGTEFYCLDVYKSDGLYWGLLAVLHLDSEREDFNQPDPAGAEQTVDYQLVFSRDGIRWKRLANRQPFLALGDHESWEDLQLWMCPPAMVGDELWFYYSGVNVRHQIPDLKLSGRVVDGRWRGGCLGLATLRSDGWVSLNAGDDEGSVATEPFTFLGNQLFLNADAAQGHVLVEVLSAEGQPLEGFTRSDCIPCDVDSVRTEVHWRNPSIGVLQGNPVRLRFHLRRARLFAFWFDTA